MARTPASDGRAGVGKSGSPAPRSITSSPAALRRFASCAMAIVAEVSRWCRLGERPDPGVMGERIARTGKGTQPNPPVVAFHSATRYHPLPTDRPLTTEDRVTAADAKVALERGRPVVLVRPPAVECVRDLWELLGPLAPGRGSGVGPRVLVLCADDASAAEWVAAAPGDRPVHAVTGLARTSRVLKERPVDILAGAVKDLAVLLERAALKLDAVASVVLAWPEALVEGDGAAALDTLLGEARDAHRIVLSWNPALLGDFLERHARRALVVGMPPVDETGRPLPPACRARFAVVPSFRRSLAVRDALDTLSATTPFVWNGGPITPPEAGEGPRVRVFVGLGKKDRASAKDLVGALIREAGIAKGDIGRIEVRETFSLVEVGAAAAEQAVRGLTGTTIRGRRVVARLDRER